MTIALQKAPTAILKTFEPTGRGVVGLADDLLRLCREGSMHLSWETDRCRVRFSAEKSDESYEVPLAKSVFRALLARLAALCNEHKPNSVSPYGGQGELLVGTESPELFQATFTNAGSEQKLVLMHLRPK